VANRYPRNLKRQEIIDGISVTRVLFPGFYLSSLSPSRIIKYVVTIMIGTANSLRLCFYLKNKRPDVVNIHFVGSQAPFTMFASKLLSIKCVVSLHGDDVEGLPYRSRIDKWLFRKIVTASDHVTACSAYLLEEAKKLAPGIVSKSSVVHNGIRPEEFQNVQPYMHLRPYIFAAGRLVYKKGFDILLDAYRRILDKGLKVDLILAGDGPEKKRLFALAADLGVSLVERDVSGVLSDGGSRRSNKIIFWGNAEKTDMRSLMKGCELFVIPSRKEPFGIVALEAFAAEKKVVAARVGGLQEIVHEDQGHRLVRPESVEDLAEGIVLVLRDNSGSGLCRLRGDTWTTVSMKYLDIFQTIKK
jgi:glycosyltransferase involved in cell wall biosynthesis